MRPVSWGFVAFLWIAVAGVSPLSAQGISTGGLRLAVGRDSEERTVLGGQVEFSDLGGRESVELAVVGFGDIGISQAYSVMVRGTPNPVTERTRLRGLALGANWLLNRSSRGVAPYFLVGLGIGPIWIDWSREQTNAFGVVTSESRTEENVMVGTLLNGGVGVGLGRHLDVRAQMTMVAAPPTESREGLKVVPFFTLATGIGLP